MKKLEKEIRLDAEGGILKDPGAKKKQVDALFSKASSKGVIHKNKARNKISRLTKIINSSKGK